MIRLLPPIVALLLVMPGGAARAQAWDPRALEGDPATATSPLAPVLQGLGDHHHAVTTNNPQSQAFFDQGLRLAFAFNHSEAVRAFKEAARLDHGNAMAYWGWAYALGPNLNLPMQPETVAQAWDAVHRALQLRDHVTPAERGYIEALAKRYSADPASIAGPDRAALDQGYARAMGEVAAQYPDDPDAAVVYAEAMMDRSPWHYWLPDGEPGEDTGRIVGTLEAVIARHPDHAGALHFYIHAMEVTYPERAVAVAERLVTLMPAAGHMVHMPSHIFMRVGRYADAWRVNVLADAADDAYVAQCRAQGIYPFFYHRHNQHFMVWAALFQGRSAAALAAARKIGEGMTPAMVQGPLSETLQHLIAQPLYTLVRFGRWQDILREPRPPAEFSFMTGVWHYARGVAFANRGNAPEAMRELTALRQLGESPGMKDRLVGFAPAPVVLRIGAEIVTAELASRRGEHSVAVEHLDRAVRLQDGLTYNEPPDWYFPARHYLGAELLKAGRADEAATVYWQDLARNPDNGYALFGLAAAMRATGHTAGAAAMDARFRTAWKDADVQLTSSRF